MDPEDPGHVLRALPTPGQTKCTQGAAIRQAQRSRFRPVGLSRLPGLGELVAQSEPRRYEMAARNLIVRRLTRDSHHGLPERQARPASSKELGGDTCDMSSSDLALVPPPAFPVEPAHTAQAERPARALIGWMRPEDAHRFLLSNRNDAAPDAVIEAAQKARYTVAARPDGIDQHQLVTALP